MEDLQPMSAAEETSFCVELMKRLNMQRKQDCLCDVALLTNDDRKLKAHRNILSAASPFFCKLLQSDMKENREGVVRFEEISGSIMEDVLEFIYTGTVEVTSENAKELIAAGNYLIMPNLKKISGRFLELERTTSNCISTFYFAEKYDCGELIDNSQKFIRSNFSSVATMHEFLRLDVMETERWLSSDEVSVEVEAYVFKIILKWIEQNESERKGALEKLFRHVRLDFLSRDYLIDVVTNEFVQENFVCLKTAIDALKRATFSDEVCHTQSPRIGFETSAIVAWGGKYFLCYLPEKNEWKLLADTPDSTVLPIVADTVVQCRGQLYVFSAAEFVNRYDPVVNSWSSLDLFVDDDYYKMAVVRGDIYAVGKLDTSEEQTKVIRYNIELCAWETVLSSHSGFRQDACVVAAGRHLYVIGGRHSEGRYVAKAERFDTVGGNCRHEGRKRRCFWSGHERENLCCWWKAQREKFIVSNL